MSFDLPALEAAVAAHGPVMRLLIVSAAGSTPRGAGCTMLVWQDGMIGTIGGGVLEYEAVAKARQMLSSGAKYQRENLALGPALGQCCGGAVVLVTERFCSGSLPKTLPFARGPGPVSPKARATQLQPGALPVELDGCLIEAAPAAPQPVWIFGAGHIGRALAAVLAPMPDLAVTLIDISQARMPTIAGTTPIVVADPARLARSAPQNAWHLVVTHSHALDLAICHALLQRGFGSAGLIGSATKWARFRKRLGALGHDNAQISGIACPMGDPSLGKHPQAIAVSIAAALLSPSVESLMQRETAV
ncbi:MAG: xanthine dehydrogenase accessory protein XdhC [Rhodobacteraceae bacterium]|nr:xanthine dehydrogenase accessory protein XdhC [Paracoccaceae bacterium]